MFIPPPENLKPYNSSPAVNVNYGPRPTGLHLILTYINGGLACLIIGLPPVALVIAMTFPGNPGVVIGGGSLMAAALAVSLAITLVVASFGFWHLWIVRRILHGDTRAARHLLKIAALPTLIAVWFIVLIVASPGAGGDFCVGVVICSIFAAPPVALYTICRKYRRDVKS